MDMNTEPTAVTASPTTESARLNRFSPAASAVYAPSPLKVRFAWRGVGEAAALIAVLLVLDRIFGDGHRFLGVEPHPFGIAVILVAAQYGTAEAAAAAILASVALLAFNLPEQHFDQHHYAWLQGIVRDPLIWLTSSLIIGEISGRTRQRAREGAALAMRREGELGTMVQANTDLVDRVTMLETRIAGQQRTVTSIYEAARRLGPDREAVLSGAIALVRAATGATSTSIYLLNANILVPAGGDGWNGAKQSVPIHADRPFFQAVIGERRLLVSNKAADRDALDRVGLLAGPLLNSDGAVLGALVVESIPFTQLHLGAVASFRSVCEWVGDGLERAQQFDAAQQGRFLVEGSSLVAAAQSDRLIGIMGATARRIGFDLTLMQLDLDAFAAAAEPRRTLLTVLEAILRDTDLLLEGEEKARLLVLMPGTPLRNVSLVAERLHAALAGQNLALLNGVSTSWLSLNERATIELVP